MLHQRQRMSVPEPLTAAVRREQFATFARLLPGADPATVTDVRRAFCAWLHHTRLRFATWPAAWNHFIGPRETVHYTPARCRTCNGRGFVTRPVCGGPVCPACGGRRRGATVLLPARRALAADPLTIMRCD